MATDNSISFYLNGESVTVENPSPDFLLIDYLRSPEVSLSGAKKGCGQGGCGACTVILSHWNPGTKSACHRSINSCLRPVCSLQGLAVTTIEGTSAARRLPPENPKHVLSATRAAAPFNAEHSPLAIQAQQESDACRSQALKVEAGGASTLQADSTVNPVAYRLAENNGTQCGYCSTGFVMNMSAFLANNPEPTKKQIEEAFDGNICRCTGYRPILTAMKTFAIDWTTEDEEKRMKCVMDEQMASQPISDKVEIPFPAAAECCSNGADIEVQDRQYLSPTTVTELCGLFNTYPHDELYLIHANTAFGVYTQDFLSARVLVDISRLKELYGQEHSESSLMVGAGTTYSEFLTLLDTLVSEGQLSQTSRLGALQFMTHRTAGTIVRNAATLAGNTMLVLKHIAAGTGEPFPSDLFTVLSALDAEIEYIHLVSGRTCREPISKLLEKVIHEPVLANQILLLAYHIDTADRDEIVLAQKVALRDINAHSVVNTTSILTLSESLTIEDINLTFGAIAPYPWRARKTEAMLQGQTLSLDNFSDVAAELHREVSAELKHFRSRMQGLEYEGFTDEYRIELATSFVYKALVNALDQRDPGSLPENLRSSGVITWGNWPTSDGQQFYKNQAYKAPVSQPYVKLMALYQTSGQVRYTHEMEVPPTAVNGSMIQSQRALADFSYKDPVTGECGISAEQLTQQLKSMFPDLLHLVTCNSLPPGGLNYQGMGGDQPVFAEKRVSYVGQVIALAIAVNETRANQIAQYISDECIHYEKVDWPSKWQQPVLGLDDAIARGSIFPDGPSSASYVTHIWKIVRPGSQFDWSNTEKAPLDKSIVQRSTAIDGIQCTVVENTQTTGGQVHFYMETQSCVAEPIEAERLKLTPSSQSPMSMHQTAASVLATEHNQIEVGIRQLGGGYGGKTEQARFVSAAAAIAAKELNRPVRLIMPRDNDTSMIGKRHPYYGQYQIAIDNGDTDPNNKGIIRGVDANFWGDGGAFYDCSFIVSNCLQTRVDNSYKVANFRSTLDVCRTNTAPNTAFRSFGDIQGKLVIENAIDDAAFAIGLDPDQVRERNLYERGDVTPFGQALTYCYIRDVWQYLKDVSNFDHRKKEVDEFNRKNKWRKRGLYMLPVKYGNGYNLVQLEQASALVSIYSGDGSIIINQGGVDMGQGAITKIEQIAAYILNVPMDMIQVQSAKTDVVPNPTSTGGSTGTAYNGLAVKQTCERLRGRLVSFGYEVLKQKGDDWCRANGVDFWNYGVEGWAATPKGKTNTVWQNLVALAYRERVSLMESFNAKVPGGTDPMPCIIYKPESEQQAIPGIELAGQPIGGEFDSFSGWTFSAACTEVEVDILTGEVKILRSDLMYDMGWSLNPALDIGQVEGAFIQGVGYVMTEQLVFEPEGEHQGRLNTVNTWRYKPPATTNIPLEFNVHLFPRDHTEVPENPNELMSAKEVGEPPLVLASSVFFAIKAAVRASRLERGLDGLFQMDAPATPQEVRRACNVTFT